MMNSIVVYVLLPLLFLIASIKNFRSNDNLHFLWKDVFYLVVLLLLVSTLFKSYFRVDNLYDFILIATGVESMFSLMNLNNYKQIFIAKTIIAIIILFII